MSATTNPLASLPPDIQARIQAAIAAQQSAPPNTPVQATPPDVSAIGTQIGTQQAQANPIAAPPMQATQPLAPPPTPSGPVQQVATQVAAQSPPFSEIQPSAAPSPDVSAKPGPVKSFLMNFLHGAGQGLVKHAGLETDAERQQRLFTEGIQQQAATDTSAYRQAQTGNLQSKSDQLDALMAPHTITADDQSVLPQFRGTTTTFGKYQALQELSGKVQGKQAVQDSKNASNLQVGQLKYGDGSTVPYVRRGFANVGGRYITYDKADPMNTRQDMGPANSVVSGVAVANARAAAQAKYRTFDTVDGNGNPVTISGLDALQGGAAHTPYAQAKGVKSDLVGIQQYRDILDNKITPNLSVLNDNTQRAVIAHTLEQADKNPGMFQTILTSGLQSGELSPAGAKLVAGIMQGREFGGVARKYGGNMNGTEGLMNRIMANQARPLNSEQVNRELIANDRAFTDKAMTVVNGITSHNAGNKGGPPNVAPVTPIEEYIRVNGKLVKK